MSRNGPVGQPAPRIPARRSPADQDPYANGQSGWPQDQPHRYDPNDPGQQGYPPHAPPPLGAAQPHSHGYYFPQSVEPAPNYGYTPQPVSQSLPFDRFPPGAPHAQPHWDAQHDAGHYDLGSYMPAGSEARGYGQPEPPPFGASPEGPFRHHYGNGQDQGYGESDEEYDELLDEDEQPRRGRRGLMIAGALAGAIGIGGAMAYVYKSYIATPTRAPVVKVTDTGPTKVKPSLPGGKEFPHTDKKLLNRLDEDAAAQRANSEDRAGSDPNAPRIVRSIPISPAGQVMTANSAPPPSGPAPAVPGIMLDTMRGPPPSPPPPAAFPQARSQLPPAQPPAAASPPPPAMPARAEPVAPPPVRVVAPAPQQPPPPVEAAPPARRMAAAPPVAAPARPQAPAASASTSGYVAVLSSQKSRMDALKAFADLQQKYGDVLSSKTPDVQEANLGDRGIWYRAVVGPPVSRDAASGICSQLKSAGYTGCWVTAY